MPISVLIAPSGFKESLSVGAVTEAIAEGVKRALPQARILKAPMVDGGEGFVEALVAATHGEMLKCRVVGPVGEKIDSFFGILGGQGPRTAVIEMAAAAGLSLVPRDRRDPTKTTSYGVGQLIKAALNRGVDRILVGCGDSGINDAGAGMVQALGGLLVDANGYEIGYGGGELGKLAHIDLSHLDRRLSEIEIDVAVNWHNILLGPKGVARVFAPQKGASPEQVEQLDHALTVFARVVLNTMNIDVSSAPGTGASGGLGAALTGLLGAKLHPRYDIVMKYLEFEALLERADLVITAEGSLDGQTPYGKIPAEVGRRARERGVPVIALAGTIGKGCAENFAHGIQAFASIVKRPCTLQEAIRDAEELLIHAAEDAVRMVRVGLMLNTNARARRTRPACQNSAIMQQAEHPGF